MKKSFLMFVLLFLLAVGGTVTAQALLLERKDAVEITENVRYGDKSIVDGVTIYRNTKYDSHIQWKTVYQVKETPEYATAYDFSASGVLSDSAERSYGVEVYSHNTNHIDRIESGEELEGIAVAYKELLDETEPGERLYKTISLADYQDFYTVDLRIEVPGYTLYTMFHDAAEIRASLTDSRLNEESRANLERDLKIIECFNETLKIPVVKNHMYRIAVEKNMEGRLCSWGYSTVNGGGSTNGMEMHHEELPEETDGFTFFINSAMTEDTFYFTFNTRTDKGKIVDTSYMPQGYGIYSFRFDETKKEIDIDSMKNSYPLEPSVSIVALEVDNQQENLLIFSEEGNERVLTIVDLDTMEQKQQFVYADSTEAYHAYIYDDFMVVRYTWEDFVILSRNTDGIYTKEYAVNIEELMNLTEIYGDMVFDWNGRMLLMGDSLVTNDYYYSKKCGFYLAAFDEEGLQYYGEYTSSLDTGKEYIDYYFNCMPMNKEPLILQWKE